MLRNYITVALRGLVKNPLYSAINIFGLAVGLASCILILLYVRHETSFDQWIPNAERIYMVHTRYDIAGREPMIGASASGPALPALLKDFDQIESGVRIIRQRPVIRRDAEVFREDVYRADASFFDVFKLPMATGQGAEAFKDTSAVLLSETVARKYFGSASPIGQVLPMSFSYPQDVLKRDYKVAGVFKDLPTNTHIDMGILAPVTESDFDNMPWMRRSWVSDTGFTFIKLKPGVDIAPLAAALPEFERRNIPDLSFGGADLKTSDVITLSVMSLKDVHLHAPSRGMGRPVGNAKSIATFAVVAVMILVIACINFTNLATARASQRAREVALRKVLGAKRPQLVVQFLGESLLTALLAFALALVIVALVLPLYNTVLQRDLALDFASGLLPLAAVFIIFVGLAAGLYPALYLSGFRPARILKANKSAAAEGSGRLRSALVVIQFAISIGLLVCTAVVYGQTVYARSMDLGYDRNGVLVVRGLGGDDYKVLRTSLANEVAKAKGVISVAWSDDVPTDDNSSNNIAEVPGKPSPDPILLLQKNVDYTFFFDLPHPAPGGAQLRGKPRWR